MFKIGELFFGCKERSLEVVHAYVSAWRVLFYSLARKEKDRWETTILTEHILEKQLYSLSKSYNQNVAWRAFDWKTVFVEIKPNHTLAKSIFSEFLMTITVLKEFHGTYFSWKALFSLMFMSWIYWQLFSNSLLFLLWLHEFSCCQEKIWLTVYWMLETLKNWTAYWT